MKKTNLINKKLPSLNIISTLYLSKDKLFVKQKMFNNIIANISLKRDDELSFNDENLKLIFFRLYALGYSSFNIIIFSKDFGLENNIIDIKGLLKKMNYNDDNVITNYNVSKINVINLLELSLIEKMLDVDIPTIYVFNNMS